MIVNLGHIPNQSNEREGEGDRTADRKTEPITVRSEWKKQISQSRVHRDEEGRCIRRSLMIFEIQQHEREDEDHRVREGPNRRHLEDVPNLRREPEQWEQDGCEDDEEKRDEPLVPEQALQFLSQDEQHRRLRPLNLLIRPAFIHVSIKYTIPLIKARLDRYDENRHRRDDRQIRQENGRVINRMIAERIEMDGPTFGEPDDPRPDPDPDVVQEARPKQCRIAIEIAIERELTDRAPIREREEHRREQAEQCHNQSESHARR